jgi:hypothetical protein
MLARDVSWGSGGGELTKAKFGQLEVRGGGVCLYREDGLLHASTQAEERACRYREEGLLHASMRGHIMQKQG